MELIKECFGDMSDFRLSRKRLHSLIDIIFICICGVICGEEDYVGIRFWAVDNEQWLKQYIGLANGIPSDDTFRRVFQLLDYQEFSKCFISFTNRISTLSLGEVVSIDGKCLRGSKENKSGKKGIYMVGAWANKNQVLLGQEKVEEKSNEITCIPKLLELLVLKGCIITIDAMGCQRDIAQKIVEKEANYILAVKGNQPSLESQIIRSFEFQEPLSTHKIEKKAHGRLETRTCEVITDLKWIEEKENWKDLNTIIKVSSKRHIISENKITENVRYFISNQVFNAEKMLYCIRSHWGIENNLHWQLDISFHEDMNRNRTLNAAANFSFLNRIALNVLKKDESKMSIKHKRNKANRDNEYLKTVLNI